MGVRVICGAGYGPENMVHLLTFWSELTINGDTPCHVIRYIGEWKWYRF